MVPVRKFIVCLGLLGMIAPSALAADEPTKTVAAPPRVHKIEDFAPANEFYQVGSVKTHVVQMGKTGRPIVLIHGFGSCTYTWRQNLEPLSKSYRVYAIDVKGFGLTEKPRDGQYHLAAYTQHLLDTIDLLKLEKPILVGNSMGGAIIARLALLHPDRIGGIVLVDAAPLNWTPPTRPTQTKDPKTVSPAPSGGIGDKLKVALARSLINKGMIESGLKSAFFDPSIVTPEMVEMHYRPFTIDGAPEALLAMMNPPAIAGPKLPPLRDLKTPALIVWGKHDRIIPVSVADMFSRDLPKARKVILDKSGHLPHEEEPETFNALVAEFAASVP